MKIDFSTYNKKVRSCFVGKSVGGTLGMRYEGSLDYHEVTYYDPVPDKMIPNDDLDLQVINLESVMRSGLPVCRYHLGETWKYHIADHAPDEYAVAVSNYNAKLNSPLSGIYRNKFYAGMGGAIRSELWACLAPANPALAAKFARENACTDHYSDGVYAEMFLAAVESAAFVENDLIKLIDIGLKYIPDGVKLKKAFIDVINWWNDKNDILSVRELILDKYIVDNWTDVTINLCFILLSLLCCKGDFDKAICTAASLTYDADCTAATVGSIFGIINPDGIDKKWTEPIGDALVLSPGIVNMHEPKTINEFCDRIIVFANEVEKYYKTGVELSVPENFADIRIAAPWTNDWKNVYNWCDDSKESLALVKPLLVNVVYPDTVATLPATDNNYALKLTNILSKKVNVKVSVSLPEGFIAVLSESEVEINVGESVVIPLSVKMEALRRRAHINLMTVSLLVNEIPVEFDVGLPVSYPWLVENLETEEKSIFEADNIYFNVPKGKYKYTAKFISPTKKEIRMTITASGFFTAYLNGEIVKQKKEKYYVPGFHRGRYWFKTLVETGENTVEIVFDNDEDIEFFLGFATIDGCACMLDTMERYI